MAIRSTARQGRRRRRAIPLVSVAAMGDIAFQLIVFFAVASKFIQQANVELEEPTSVNMPEFEPPRVAVIMDAEGIVYLNNDRVTTVEALADPLTAALAGREDKRVMVTIDRNLTSDVWDPLRLTISEAGGTPVYRGELEK